MSLNCCTLRKFVIAFVHVCVLFGNHLMVLDIGLTLQLYVYKSGTRPYWSLLLHRSYHNDWSEGFLNEHLILHIFLICALLFYSDVTSQPQWNVSVKQWSCSIYCKCHWKFDPFLICHHRLCDIFTIFLAGQFSQDDHGQKTTVFPSAVIYIWPLCPSHMHTWKA